MCKLDYIPGFSDKDGNWRKPKSMCCNAGLVYLHEYTGTNEIWQGWEDSVPLERLRCRKCHRAIQIKEEN